MTVLSPIEPQAFQAALKAWGEFMDTLGPDRRLYDYSEEEALKMVQVIVHTYQKVILARLSGEYPEKGEQHV